MGLIRKIVLTPIKWAVKKVIHKTLLEFPKQENKYPVACVYCPEMCRFSCPTAVVTGNDAVTPRGKVSLLYKEEKWPGKISKNKELWPIYDCTGCGRCSKYCVYEIPVADILLEARQENKWNKIDHVILSEVEKQDKIGDLLDELGFPQKAENRLNQFLVDSPVEVLVDEPKELFYLRKKGIDAKLSWGTHLNEKFVNKLKSSLSGERWLIAESVWLNRRLNNMSVNKWIKELSLMPEFNLVLPFQSGDDCMETAGEGAYQFLFADQAKKIAQEYYQRDRKNIDGILCFSNRMANHFRASLNSDIEIKSIIEIYNEK